MEWRTDELKSKKGNLMKWDSTVGWEGEGVVGVEGKGIGEDSVKKLQNGISDPMELVVIIIY